MSKFYKLLTIVTCIFIFICNLNYIHGDDLYQIIDAYDDEEVASFSSLEEANRFYKDNVDNYENLTLIYDGNVIKMEYGVVEFRETDSTINSEYESIYSGYAYLNASYSSEVLYLSTDKNYNYVYFKISDDVGYISLDEVKLIPYEHIDTTLSKYYVHNKTLYHNIKTSLDNNYYSFSIPINNSPDYLKEDESYYSYDGHYFYDDFKLMSIDSQNDISDNAINADDPFYNYYAYLPHRSYTNYSKAEVEDYFYNSLGIDGKIAFYDDLNRDNANDDVNLSQLYNEFASFFGYEKIYGANAMMMLSLACHESSYGKSFLSFTNNNLFGHAAYDSDPSRNANRYTDIDESVYAHAKHFISHLYSSFNSSFYYGSYFGNKLSGMNVAYSSDPYWAEKASGIYYKLDKALGYKDQSSYALGIVKAKDSLRIYRDVNLSSTRATLKDLNNYSFIILEDLDGVYKVQLDDSFSNNYKYNPETSIGYIKSSEVTYLLNEESIKDINYDTYTYDLNIGSLNREKEIDIYCKENLKPILSNAKAVGYEFVKYDDDQNAEYKEVKSIELINGFNSVIELDYVYDLRNGKLKVNYVDGTNKTLPIDSTMIYNFDFSKEGESNITITYAGLYLDYPITISSEIREHRSNLKNMLYANIYSFKEDGTYNKEEVQYIKENLSKVDYLVDYDDIRIIDQILLTENKGKVNYNIKANKYDLSVSGLALGLDNSDSINIIKPFKDTYYVNINECDNDSYVKMSNVAKSYGFEIEEGFNISFNYNLQKTDIINPIIVQLKIDNKQDNRIYSVYHLDDNGNIVKCYTKQSKDYISFMTRTSGNFIILSLDSVNLFDYANVYENINLENSDPDNHMLFIEGSIMLFVVVFGFIMVIVYNILDKKEKKIWNDYRKYLQEVESLQEEKPKN